MTLFEFFEILNDNPFTYLICLLISLFFFSYVMMKSTSSWFNPLRFNIFTFSIGTSVILFLNFLGYVKTETFVYMILSIIVFWFAFIIVFKNRQREVIVKFGDEPLLANYLFYVCYFLFILLTLVSYIFLGIPAFNEEGRLSTYTGSGLGFISRLTPILYLYSVFYIIHLFNCVATYRKKILPFFLLIPILIIGVLSGSRSSFLVLVFAFWGYRTFFLHNEPKALNYKKLIYPTILFSIISFLINSSGDFFLATYMFFERVIACGDLYWEALPNEAWRSVIIKRPFEFTFMGFLGPLHILNPSQAEIPIGFQLTDIIYPSISGRSTGPVALFPVFGLVCFGYFGGIVLSLCQALLVSYLFKKAFIKSNSIILSSMAYFGFSSVTMLIGDVSAGLGTLLEVIIGYIFIIILLFLIASFIFSRDILFRLKIIKREIKKL